MMFKAAIVIICCLAVSTAYAQNTFTIKGKLGKDKEGKLKIFYRNGGEYIKDSTQVKNGVFELKGKVGDPNEATIVLNPSDPQRLTREDDVQQFFLEATTIHIKSNEGIKTAVIKAGKTQEDYIYLMNQYKPLGEQQVALNEKVTKAREEKNETEMARLQKVYMSLKQKRKDIDSAFASNNPDSFLAFLLAFKQELKGLSINPNIIEPQFMRFNKNIRNSEKGKKLAARIATSKKIDIGMPAPDFTLKDTLGQPISLSSLKGKYVLVWFWHSMVMGINKQIFIISQVNKKIQKENFTILGVSYERDAQMRDGEMYREASIKSWKKNIRENNMNWLNINDYGGIIIKENKPVSQVAKAYDLNYYNIPQCILIGPDGKILLRTYLGKDLVEKVHKIVGGSLAQTEGENNFKIGGQMLTYPKVEWLKGSPVTHFDKNSIYIVDLWATWCKPCIAAMPHLNTLSKKFKDKVTFIAQDVWESDKEKVVKFLQEQGADWNFKVAFAGSKGGAFDKEWCVPAFVNGIPTTFVIQNNKLVWQTHPSKLTEEIAQSLIDGTFEPREAE